MAHEELEEGDRTIAAGKWSERRRKRTEKSALKRCMDTMEEGKEAGRKERKYEQTTYRTYTYKERKKNEGEE